MRLAILSDVHGNPIALDAVLRDIKEQGGVDQYWGLGDFAAIGYDPVTPIERLSALPNASFVRGNTDRYVATGDRPGPTVEQARANPELVAALAEKSASFAWTLGYVTGAGSFDWLASLPLEQRLVLPDGTRVLGVHAAPGTDDGDGINPRLSDAELLRLLDPAEADLIFVAHTHVPLDRTVGGRRVINLGSVSNPMTGDPRASYVILEADRSGHQVTRRRVAYDYAAAIAAVEQSRHPAGSYIIRHLRNEVRSRWLSSS
jgi:predicted phosphodiesterase